LQQSDQSIRFRYRHLLKRGAQKANRETITVMPIFDKRARMSKPALTLLFGIRNGADGWLDFA
jgi:hypothetical protein